MNATSELSYKKVDIGNEVIQIDPAEYEHERQLVELHKKKMQPEWSAGTQQISCVFEAWEDKPIRFFLFESGGQHYCGRKLLSPIVTDYGAPGFFCSLIKIEMLLGKFLRSQTSQQGVEIFYLEMSVAERINLFDKLKNDRMIDIYHPFVHLNKKDRLEINTSDKGWSITNERANLLSIGEKYLRKISTTLVKSDQLKSPVIYDPACSTGKFLSEIKQELPDAIVIGQDLSPAMCKWAAPKLDKVIVGNSMQPGVADKSCDYIFFRFLNAEVVSTQLAKQLFERIICCLKENGKAILFGHTPVLISTPLIKTMGYDLLSCNEYVSSEAAICQYYVIQRSK